MGSARFRPFGELISVSGPKSLDARFPGQWFQFEAGLHANWHRNYDPTLGRYLEADPLGFPDGPNRYAYVGSSPLMYVDPEGKHAILAAGLVGAAVGAVIGGLTDFGTQLLFNGGNLSSVDPWQVGFSTGLGLVGGAAGGMLTGVRSAKCYVDGYRAISKAEADDIAKNGFRPGPNSLDVKWFAETLEGAEKFRKQLPDADRIIKTKVPKDVYDRSFKAPNLDNNGPSFCVKCQDLPKLPKP